MTRPLAVADLYSLAIPEEPALSPDGARIAYVLRTIDPDGDRDHRSLWMVSAAGGTAEALTEGPGDVSPAWSRDGRSVAFVRESDSGSQLCLLDPADREVRWTLELSFKAGAPAWSPDGSTIAMRAGVDDGAGPDASREPARPVVASDLGRRRDGVPRQLTSREHVCLVDVSSRSVRLIDAEVRRLGRPAWSPDGARIAFTGILDEASSSDAAAPAREAVRAYVVDVKAAAVPTRVGPAERTAQSVTWCPDGISLIVAGAQIKSAGHTRLMRVWLDSGEVRLLDEGLDRNVRSGAPGYPGAPPQLRADGSEVVFLACDRGHTRPYAVPIDGGLARPLLDAPELHVNSAGLGGDAQTAVVVLCTPSTYGEIATIGLDSGALAVCTSHTADALGEVALLTPQEVTFDISDGGVVSGWMLGAQEGAGPQPLLLDIHGGPHNTWTGVANPVHLYQQVLAGLGWIVLFLNPRGSDGYGEDFYRAGVGAWGLADRLDQLEPLDHLVAEGIADPARLGVVGYSYGGFMTCQLTSTDGRFAAACAGGLICDLTSFVGTSDEGDWIASAELAALPWESPDLYANLSPLTRVGDVVTPTLVLHGLDDARCPVGQADQWFFALRKQGVPARQVVYPGASHLMAVNGRPSHRADWNQRIVDWFSERVSPGA